VFVKAFVAAYGKPPLEVALYFYEGLGRVRNSLEEGDLILAMMKATFLKFPEIEPENMAKLEAGELAKYNHKHRLDNGHFDFRGGMEEMVVTAHRMPSKTPSKAAPKTAPAQWVSSAPPPGTNKVASVTVDSAQGFVTPAKPVEFSAINDELRVVTKGGGVLSRRDGKSGLGSVLGVGEFLMWGNIYDVVPVTGDEKPIGHFREPIPIRAGVEKETTIKIPHSGYIKAYVQGSDTTLPNTKVDIYN
jgi:hypothetical protein